MKTFFGDQLSRAKLIVFGITVIFLLVIMVQSCSKSVLIRDNYYDVNSLIHNTNQINDEVYLKAHMKNGDVYVFPNEWQLEPNEDVVIGKATQYDPYRKELNRGILKVKVDEVALFETNRNLTRLEANRIGALTALGGVNIGFFLVCIASPKTCYGSCPTFYTDADTNFHYADAEGFTHAILPSMAYADIDAIGKQRVENGHFSLTMKNEAMETHVVDDVQILAFPISGNERVYHAEDDKFYKSSRSFSPKSVRAKEGDISELLALADKQERFSLANENNLSSKEEIILEFDRIDLSKTYGFNLHYRQTLLTTFLFYSALDYMGNEASDILARLDSEDELKSKFDATANELGNIEVYAWHGSEQKWIKQGEFSESGPIAINKQLISLGLDFSTENLKVKLVLNEGLWRIDFASLVEIDEELFPYPIKASALSYKGEPDETSLALIHEPGKSLLSYPGDAWQFDFQLPTEHSQYEVFLYSKGYYLEWLRNEWFEEKNLMMLKMMVFTPKLYLKIVAKEFKKYESEMEAKFWASRVDTKLHSYFPPKKTKNKDLQANTKAIY
jgi:hypothetical protein